MNMKRKINMLLEFGIGLTVLFVAGCVILVLARINAWSPFIVTLGVVGLIFGLFCAPMFYVNYYKASWKYKLIELVEKKGLRTVTALSSTLKKNKQKVKNAISILITNGYIYGFDFDGFSLTPKDKK